MAMRNPKRCNLDCLNCKLPVCLHDLEDEKEYITTNIISEIGERLLEAMEAKNISAKKLCKIAHISQPTVSGYVRGTRKPAADNIYKICKALDISSDWLLGLKNEE